MEQESVSENVSQKGFPFDADISEILSLGLEINHIIILSKLLDKEILPEHPKIGAWIQTLERKGYIEKDFSVTQAGLELIIALQEKKSSIKQQLKPKINLNEAFDEWWAAFPAADTFTYKGRRFVGSRSLKNSKDKCKALYTAIIKKGQFTHEQLLAALKAEITAKKEKSIKKNENQMSFMKNSHAYLHQGAYEGFIGQESAVSTGEDTVGQTFSI